MNVAPQSAGDGPPVSIIVPVYGRVDLLPETLASIADQTFGDYELILCDDGTVPPLERWIRWLAPNARYVRLKKNAGPAAARNEAIRHARGEYLAFIDSDDVWEPETLHRHVQTLDEDPDAVLTFVDTVRTGLDFATRKPVPADPEAQRKRLATSNFIYTLSQVAVRRETFGAVGGFDESLRNCEDQKLYAQCLGKGRLTHIDYPGVHKREAGENISRSLAVRFESIARYSAWAAHAFSDRSRGALYTASACVALKTMAGRASAAWWKHWLGTTLRYPIHCLTHGGWYFALAVKAYRFLSRHWVALKRLEFARASRRPDLRISHAPGPEGRTELLTAVLRLIHQGRPDALGIVVASGVDASLVAAYERLGLAIAAGRRLSSDCREGKTPLLVITEPEAASQLANHQASAQIDHIRQSGAEIVDIPGEGLEAHDVIAAACPVGPPIGEPAGVLITLPEKLVTDSLLRDRLIACCDAQEMMPVFIPAVGVMLPDSSTALCLTQSPRTHAYAWLARRAAAVITSDPVQHRLAHLARRPTLLLPADKCPSDLTDRLREWLTQCQTTEPEPDAELERRIRAARESIMRILPPTPAPD